MYLTPSWVNASSFLWHRFFGRFQFQWPWISLFYSPFTYANHSHVAVLSQMRIKPTGVRILKCSTRGRPYACSWTYSVKADIKQGTNSKQSNHPQQPPVKPCSVSKKVNYGTAFLLSFSFCESSLTRKSKVEMVLWLLCLLSSAEISIASQSWCILPSIFPLLGKTGKPVGKKRQDPTAGGCWMEPFMVMKSPGNCIRLLKKYKSVSLPWLWSFSNNKPQALGVMMGILKHAIC